MSDTKLEKGPTEWHATASQPFQGRQTDDASSAHTVSDLYWNGSSDKTAKSVCWASGIGSIHRAFAYPMPHAIQETHNKRRVCCFPKSPRGDAGAMLACHED